MANNYSFETRKKRGCKRTFDSAQFHATAAAASEAAAVAIAADARVTAVGELATQTLLHALQTER